MIALHSIVTTLLLKEAIMIIAGTKNRTSLARARSVDFKLDPMDCNNIDKDLMIQVRMIPPKIFKGVPCSKNIDNKSWEKFKDYKGNKTDNKIRY